MPNMELLEQVIREIEKLKQDFQKISTQKKLYEIVNSIDITLNADQTAWDIPDVDYIKTINLGAARTIHGIANGVAGRVLYISNTGVTGGTFTITLKHESGSAAAINRVNNLTGADVSITAGQSVILIYDMQDSAVGYRWRQITPVS